MRYSLGMGDAPVQEPRPMMVTREKIEEFTDKALEDFPNHLFIERERETLKSDMIERYTGIGVDKDHNLRMRNNLFALEIKGRQSYKIKISLCRHRRKLATYLLCTKCFLQLRRERNWR